MKTGIIISSPLTQGEILHIWTTVIKLDLIFHAESKITPVSYCLKDSRNSHYPFSNPSPFQLSEKQTMTIQTTGTPLLSDQLVDMKFITKLTGLTDKWFYKLIQDGEFPKPIKLGRSSRWLRSEVEQWLQNRIAESRSPNSALVS